MSHHHLYTYYNLYSYFFISTFTRIIIFIVNVIIFIFTFMRIYCFFKFKDKNYLCLVLRLSSALLSTSGGSFPLIAPLQFPRTVAQVEFITLRA